MSIPEFKPSRYRTNYDTTVGKPLPFVYAPHLPEAARLLGFLELCRILPRVLGSDARARARIVKDYLSAGSIKKPRFKDLPSPVKAYLYAIASDDNDDTPLTHALTIHLDQWTAEAMTAMDHGFGQGRRIGDLFLNDKLEPIYRRAGKTLTYLYLLETHRGTLEDQDGATIHGRGGYGHPQLG